MEGKPDLGLNTRLIITLLWTWDNWLIRGNGIMTMVPSLITFGNDFPLWIKVLILQKRLKWQHPFVIDWVNRKVFRLSTYSSAIMTNFPVSEKTFNHEYKKFCPTKNLVRFKCHEIRWFLPLLPSSWIGIATSFKFELLDFVPWILPYFECLHQWCLCVYSHIWGQFRGHYRGL